MADDRPDDAVATTPAKPDEKKDNSGCLILFLLVMPLVDTIGVILPAAGPYAKVVLILGLVGLVCGAAIGAYVSVKIKRQPWWSACR